MLHFINILCQENSIPNDKQRFEEFLLEKKFNTELEGDKRLENVLELTKSLIDYKQPKTGDNILSYASRFGNLNLFRMFYENYRNICPSTFIDYSNNDGKSGLHEVNTR